jgi:hypothetical protein
MEISNFSLWSSFSNMDSFSSGWSIIPKPKIKEFNDITNFAVWDKVSHHKFGNGLITSLNWEIAEIAFSWIWIKKMNIKIAPVKKV